MATVIDLHQPSFGLFPVNNNRTAWRPFGLPVILVVPHYKTSSGGHLENSEVFRVRIYIEDVPRESIVSGHTHVGLKFPDRELYAISISSVDLLDRVISLDNLTAIDKDTGEDKPYSEAVDGDSLHYTTATGITDTITYISHAQYYDLSNITLEVETLPSDTYNFVYESQYFKRVTTVDGKVDFLCIDVNNTSIALFKFQIQHPGKVLNEFYRHTPRGYLTSSVKSEDSTVAFYRPFTDILQDVMDEQDLLERINWVFDAPPEAIPYLSSLLGWDIPFFPQSLDELRRAVLRRTVEFQNLKGSRRSIINIFKLFGFEILISNLWWSSDGKRLIRPDERLPAPYADEEITTTEIVQVDTILNRWQTTGFGVFNVPLLFRPQIKTGLDLFAALYDGGSITLDAYLVTKNSTADDALQAIAANSSTNPETYGTTVNCVEDSDGFLNIVDVHDAVNGLEILGYSQILISEKTNVPSEEVAIGQFPPLTSRTISFDREKNNLAFNLNGHMDMSDKSLYMFATYRRFKLNIPPVLIDLQSNRFDLQVLTQNLAEFADPATLDFAIEFLRRLKAFHSLLNVVRTRIELTETYQVTDSCIGGDIEQRYDTAMGRQQVPPAIIPNVPNVITDCTSLDPRSLGYKDSDIAYRLRLLGNLPEEHAAWKALDNRQTASGTRLSPQQPVSREACTYNPYGQDRVIGTPVDSFITEFNPTPAANQQGASVNSQELSPNDELLNGVSASHGAAVSTNANSSIFGLMNVETSDIQDPLCTLDNVRDYCYKGRVKDELLYRIALSPTDVYRSIPCSIGSGVGLYWVYPAHAAVALPGVKHPSLGSSSGMMLYSGGATYRGEQHFSNGVQKESLEQDYNTRAPIHQQSILGRLYRAYGTPSTETLHYSNRTTETNVDQTRQLALQRPELQIEKPLMHLPGCRFARFNALENDFTHPTYTARPWDDAYSTVCGPLQVCHAEPTYLNVTLVTDENGDEVLRFDTVQFKIAGNGLLPDITSYGEQTVSTLFEAAEVVHSVYMDNATSNPAIVLDNVCEYDTSVADGIIATADPLFNSHSDCGTLYNDYADGYPCISGYQAIGVLDTDRSGLYAEIFAGLGLPVSGTGDPSTTLFLFNSGIRFEKGLRYDCGCLLVGCDETAAGETLCAAANFIDSDGQYDWNPDHIEIVRRLAPDDLIGCSNRRFDGKIPSFLEML